MAALWANERDVVAKGIARDLVTAGIKASEVRNFCHVVSMPTFF
jgi:hypothetical protein